MGTYADIKSRKMVRLINWLSKNKPVELRTGGKHNSVVTCIHNGESFTIPTSHAEVNKFIVKGFMEWLVKNEICTKDEFDAQL